MNEDFSEIINNFSQILKDKNINLNDFVGGTQEVPPTQNNNENFEFDINTILKIKDILSAMNNQNSSRNHLLQSLKPYLKDSKKEKLEQYIKIANLLSVLDSLNENASLNFLKNSNYDFILMLILFLLIF